MYPKKLTIDGGRTTLNAISSIKNDIICSNIHTLPSCDVIITPPHIRTPKGRRPTKRFSKHDKHVRYKKKRKIRIEKLVSEGIEFDNEYIQKTTNSTIHTSHCCSICGLTDHNSAKCNM